MGNKYSQISTEKFPRHFFTMAFKQPDIIQILNSDSEILEALFNSIELHWSWGLKSERKLRFGLEFKLYNSPFANDNPNLEKITHLNNLITDILVRISNKGYIIISSGYIFKSFERSIWLFRKSLSGEAYSNHLVQIENSMVTSIIIDSWNKLIINNVDTDIKESLSTIISKTPRINVKSIKYTNDSQMIIEFDGQPWDSHKANSFYSPILLLNITRLMASTNYTLLCKAHIVGLNDSLFFVKQSLDYFSLNEFFILSFNHLDQIRTYEASGDINQTISKTVKNVWSKGIKDDVIQQQIWTCSLNGSPWCVQEWDKDSSFTSRLLVLKILKQLELIGWEIFTGLKFYRSQYDRNIFIMKKSNREFVRNAQFFTLTPHDADRLSFTNFPDDILKGLSENFVNLWTRGIKKDVYENGCIEFVMDSKPWLIQEENLEVNLEAVGFFCWVVELIMENDCNLITTIDICSATSFNPLEYIFEKIHE